MISFGLQNFDYSIFLPLNTNQLIYLSVYCTGILRSVFCIKIFSYCIFAQFSKWYKLRRVKGKKNECNLRDTHKSSRRSYYTQCSSSLKHSENVQKKIYKRVGKGKEVNFVNNLFSILSDLILSKVICFLLSPEVFFFFFTLQRSLFILVPELYTNTLMYYIY